MQDSLPAGGLRLYREGVEPSGSRRKVSGHITILLSRTYPDARVVYAKRPFGGPEAVLAYLSLYTHRVAISNSRLIADDDQGVAFRWKDYRARGKAGGQDWIKTMRLEADEFIRRFLIHVLPGGFHRIRHYGLLASASRRANVARARELLAAIPPPDRGGGGAQDETGEGPRELRPCPCCGGRMRIIEAFERWMQPRAPPHASATTGAPS